MQAVRTAVTTLICAILLSACGLKGPLYLPDQDPSMNPPTEDESPLNIDSTDDTQVKKKKIKSGLVSTA